MIVLRTRVAASEVGIDLVAPGLDLAPADMGQLLEPMPDWPPLAGARRIAESSGGRISAQSESGGALLRSTFPKAG